MYKAITLCTKQSILPEKLCARLLITGRIVPENVYNLVCLANVYNLVCLANFAWKQFLWIKQIFPENVYKVYMYSIVYYQCFLAHLCLASYSRFLKIWKPRQFSQYSVNWSNVRTKYQNKTVFSQIWLEYRVEHFILLSTHQNVKSRQITLILYQKHHESSTIGTLYQQ